MPLLPRVGYPFASSLWCTFCVPQDLECLTYQKKTGKDVCDSLDFWRVSYPPSSILQAALDAYIQQLPSPPQEGSAGDVSPLSKPQTRLTQAMVLSLLGVFRSLRSNTPSSLTLFAGRGDGHGPEISPTSSRSPSETRSKCFSSLIVHIRDLSDTPIGAA